MKKVILGFCFFLALPICSALAADILADSKITSVTVYPGSAVLTRTASLKLNPGEHRVLFSNIIPEIDENSLKVSASGQSGVKLFDAQLLREQLEEVPSEKIQELKDQIQKAEDDVRAAQSYKLVLQEEKNFLDSIRLFSGQQIPKDLVTKMPQVQELDSILKFLDAKLKENSLSNIETDAKIRELNKQLDALRRKLSEISGPGAGQKVKRSIAVNLEVAKSSNFDLSVSYMVYGASWQSIYDARADFQSESVELVSYGIIRQNTGEDWVDVNIALSTAKPTVGGIMPEATPWFLRPFVPRKIDKAQSRGVFMAMKAEMPAADFAVSEFGGGAPAPMYAEVEEKGVAVVYQLPKKANIKADGSDHKLPVSAQALKAAFEYSTYPRAIPSCFLRSKVTNAKDLQLLAGRVNVFLDGDFVGSSSIENIGPGEEFDLYLGLDESVKAKRELIEQKVDDVLIANIPSPNRKTTFKYKTTIENYKTKKIKLVLFDSLPVSEDEKIKVKLEKPSIEPSQKDWKDKKGVWLWELELAPKEKKEIFYTFSVEHPRDLQVEGL